MYEILFIVSYVLIAFAAFFIAIYIDRKKHPHHGAECTNDEIAFFSAIFWPFVIFMAAILGPFLLLKRLAINMATPRKNYIKDCSKDYES
jgi:presenilin-like A22 family membrane protease